MILIITLLIIGLLVLIISLRDRDIAVENSSNIYRILTVILLYLAILQAPFFYYFTFGLLSLFVIALYLLISLTLTVIVIIPLVKREKNSNFSKYGVVIAILIGSVSLFFGSSFIERLDWELRQKERNLIIEKALNGEINSYKHKMNCFPPISNGGNEVIIDNIPEGTITVKFYIDRGFIDHYSAFIYTTDTSRIKIFEARTKSDHHKTNRKLKENWYRISE